MGDAIRLIGKGSKLACSIQKGLRVAANMGSLFKSTYVVGNVVRTNIERYLINGEEFSWSQLGVDLLTVGLEILAFKSAAKGLVEAENMQVCFVTGTLITTAEGYKAIEEIQVGDMVLAGDPETGDVAYKEVTRTFVNESDELIHVHTNGEEIITTPTHPFYVNKFGWTHAADLRAGDVLVLSNGEYVVVEAIQHEILEEPVKVYNFEVEDYHTYFVGESSVWVHNWCPPRGSQEGAAELQKRATEINNQRSGWAPRMGTTCVARAYNADTGEIVTLVATNDPTTKLPKSLAGILKSDEIYIGGKGHAEETILKFKPSNYVVYEGGTSRNICMKTCAPLIRSDGLIIGGDVFRGQADKELYRQFWRP